jgi:hypothetical protein
MLNYTEVMVWGMKKQTEAYQNSQKRNSYLSVRRSFLLLFLTIHLMINAFGQEAERSISGRYAKGADIIRIEAFGDGHILAIPLWWGGYQALDKRTANVYEMQASRSTTFTFVPTERSGINLRVDGHNEINGTFRRLTKVETSPLEELIFGHAEKAYEGFKKLDLGDDAFLDQAVRAFRNMPSKRPQIDRYVRLLISKGMKQPALFDLAASSSIALGQRVAARQSVRTLLLLDPKNESANRTLRMLGDTQTSPGWTVPFHIEDAYLEPTAAELAAVERDWASRDVAAQDVQEKARKDIVLQASTLVVHVLSYRIHGLRNYGVMIVPAGAKPRSCPVLLELKGVSASFSPLDVPDGLLLPNILGPATNQFVILAPAVRGEKLLFGGQVYASEGDPADSWDGAADDAISFLNAGLQHCFEADAGRIQAFGKSRGGTVAMLVGERDPRIKSVVSWSGPAGWLSNMSEFGFSQLEMVREGLHLKSPNNGPGGQAIRTFLKAAIEGKEGLGQVRHRLIASSPIYFARRLPKAQLHYGENDFIVEAGEGVAIRKALSAYPDVNLRVKIFIEPDGGHDLNPKISVPETKSFLLRGARVAK